MEQFQNEQRSAMSQMNSAIPSISSNSIWSTTGSEYSSGISSDLSSKIAFYQNNEFSLKSINFEAQIRSFLNKFLFEIDHVCLKMTVKIGEFSHKIRSFCIKTYLPGKN